MYGLTERTYYPGYVLTEFDCISFLSSYISNVVADYPWIICVCIFLDDVGNTDEIRFILLGCGVGI